MYILLTEAMVEAVLQEEETYISRRHKTAAHFISTKTIIGLCLVAERHLGL